MAGVETVDCKECEATGKRPNWIDRGGPDLPCPWCDGTGQVPKEWIVKAHCANGFTELVGIYKSLDAARTSARGELRKSPLTECGTGGVRWCEIFGPEIEESIGVERAGAEVVETGC